MLQHWPIIAATAACSSGCQVCKHDFCLTTKRALQLSAVTAPGSAVCIAGCATTEAWTQQPRQLNRCPTWLTNRESKHDRRLRTLTHCAFCSRYDYENVDSDAAAKVMDQVAKVMADNKPGSKLGDYEIETADNFEYKDPIDGSVASKQGLRFVFTDGSRIIFRLSGTGSSGATIRHVFSSL